MVTRHHSDLIRTQRQYLPPKQGCTGHLRSPDYLELMIEIFASLGMDFALFQIFYPISGHIMDKYCLFVIFHYPSLGLSKDTQLVSVLVITYELGPLWRRLGEYPTPKYYSQLGRF